MTESQIQEVLEPVRLRQWGLLTLKQRRVRIREMYKRRGLDVDPSEKYIWLFMRRYNIRHLSTSYQIQTKVSEENLTKQRQKFVVKLLGLLVAKKKLIYMDETSFQQVSCSEI